MGKRITGSAILLLGSDGGARLLAFLANVYLARTLGTAHYGIVFLGLTVLSYAIQYGDLGLATLGMREMAKPASKREFSFADIFTVKSLTGAVAALVAGLVVLLAIDDGTRQYVAWIFLLAVIPSSWQLEWYYPAVRRYGAVAVVRYLFGGCYLAGIWFLVDSPDDVLLVPAVYVGALVIAATVAIILRKGKDRMFPEVPVFGREQLKRSQKALRRSTPIGFGGSAAQLIQLLPPVIIAGLYGDAEVGEFGAAFRLAINLMIFDRAFIALFLPSVSDLLARRSEHAPQVLRRTFRQVLAGGLVLALGITLFSGTIISLVYRDEYTRAAVPLAIMSWYVVATLMNSFFSSILVAVGIEKSYLQSSLLSSTIGIVLIVGLTWLYGIVGAAVAMTASEVLMATLMYRKYRKHVGIDLVGAKNA